MYRFLVIGGGDNSAAGLVHLSALRLIQNTSIVNGFFSRNIEHYDANSSLWSCSDRRLFYSCVEMLDHYKSDACKPIVLILTPTPDHHNLLRESVVRGYPVICEKPICSDCLQANDIKNLLDSTNTFLRTTFNYTGYPMVRELKARLLSNHIGSIQQIHVEMPQEGLVRPPLIQGESKPPQSWRLRDGDIPSVALDLGTHLYHLIYYLTDQTIYPVSSLISNHTSYPSIVDTFNVLFKSHDSSFDGSMWFTKSALGYRNGLRVRIFGSTGSFEWIQTKPEELIYSSSNGAISLIDRGAKCLEANKKRYERMKAGHPSGFIEAFANTYTDLLVDYEHSLSKNTTDTYKLGIEHSLLGLNFFNESVSISKASTS